MISIPLRLDLALEEGSHYQEVIELERSVLFSFFNENALIQKFFILPSQDLINKIDRPFLIVKGTENSNCGSYLVFARPQYFPKYFSLDLYFCPDLENINEAELIRLGPLVGQFNSIIEQGLSYAPTGDTKLNIIPIDINCTVLIFTVNDLYPSSMIIKFHNQEKESFAFILDNHLQQYFGDNQYSDNPLSLDYFINTKTQYYPTYLANFLQQIEFFDTKTGRNFYSYYSNSKGKDLQPIFSYSSIEDRPEKKYFPLIIGNQVIPDIWTAAGGNQMSYFLRDCKVNDNEYYTLWKNVFIKNNKADNIFLLDDTIQKRDFSEEPIDIIFNKTTIQENGEGVHYIIKNSSLTKDIVLKVYKNNVFLKNIHLIPRNSRLTPIEVNDEINIEAVSAVGDNSFIIKGEPGDSIKLYVVVDDVEKLKYIKIEYINNNFREINMILKNGENKLIANASCITSYCNIKAFVKKNNNEKVYYQSAFIKDSYFHQFLLIGKTENSVKCTISLKNNDADYTNVPVYQSSLPSQGIEWTNVASIDKIEQIFKIKYLGEYYYCNFILFHIPAQNRDISENTIRCIYDDIRWIRGQTNPSNYSRLPVISSQGNLSTYGSTYLYPQVNISVKATMGSDEQLMQKLPMMWIFTNGTYEEMSEYHQQKNCYFSPEAIISLIKNAEEWEAET